MIKVKIQYKSGNYSTVFMSKENLETFFQCLQKQQGIYYHVKDGHGFIVMTDEVEQVAYTHIEVEKNA